MDLRRNQNHHRAAGPLELAASHLILLLLQLLFLRLLASYDTSGLTLYYVNSSCLPTFLVGPIDSDRQCEEKCSLSSEKYDRLSDRYRSSALFDRPSDSDTQDKFAIRPRIIN